MSQVSSLESLSPADVHIGGAEAKPIYGIGANFLNEGDKGRLTPEFLAKIFATHFEQADTYRRRFVPEWLKAYQQYYGDLEDRGRAPWQNNINVPLPKQAVDQAAARIVNALFQNEDFFDIMPFNRVEDVKVAVAKNCVKWQLWTADARQGINVSLKDALICGNGPMKVYFNQEVKKRSAVELDTDQEPPSFIESIFGRHQGPKYKFVEKEELVRGLKLEPIIPTDFWLDPSGRGEYVIQRIKRSISDVWALARDQRGDDGTVLIPRVYDPEVVERLKAGQGDQRSNVEAAVIRRDTPHLQDDVSIELYEFWGKLRDPNTGVILFDNILMTIAEKMWTIRMPIPMPYRHGMAPFITFKQEEQPHQIYGQGILYPPMRIHDAINRHANVVLDKCLLQVPMVECDPLAARNPEELMGDKAHIYPAKIWQRKSPDRAIFYPVEGFQPVTEWDLAVLDKLTSWYQVGTNVTEFVTGQPQSTNRKTKDEVDQRVQAASTTFDAAARHIEQYALSPLMKMVYYLTIQFVQDYDNEALLKMFGDDEDGKAFIQSVSGLPEEERWKALYLDAEFRVTGISLTITRTDRLNRIMGFMKALQASPQLMQLLDQRGFMREMMQLYDVPKELLLPHDDAVLQAIEQQQLAMFSGAQTQELGQSSQQGPSVGQNPDNQMAAAAGQFNNMPQSQGGGEGTQ